MPLADDVTRPGGAPQGHAHDVAGKDRRRPRRLHPQLSPAAPTDRVLQIGSARMCENVSMQRSRWMRAVTVGIVVVASACGLGPGKEVASLEVEVHQPFELDFLPDAGKEYELWLRYAVKFSGADYGVSGPFSIEPGNDEFLTLTLEGYPVRGQSSYSKWRTTTITHARGGSDSSTTKLVVLPAPTAGNPVRIRGQWTAAPNTQVVELRLLITE